MGSLQGETGEITETDSAIVLPLARVSSWPWVLGVFSPREPWVLGVSQYIHMLKGMLIGLRTALQMHPSSASWMFSWHNREKVEISSGKIGNILRPEGVGWW